MLLVGTEEGATHQCSTALAADALTTYSCHACAVYAVHWNRRHPGVFLSASADWTAKLWLSGRSQVRPAGGGIAVAHVAEQTRCCMH